jgi:hypothetical protein
VEIHISRRSLRRSWKQSKGVQSKIELAGDSLVEYSVLWYVCGSSRKLQSRKVRRKPENFKPEMLSTASMTAEASTPQSHQNSIETPSFFIIHFSPFLTSKSHTFRGSINK